MSATINSRQVRTKQVYTSKISPSEPNSGVSIGDADGNVFIQGNTTISNLTLGAPPNVTINTISLTTNPSFTFNPPLTFTATYFQYADEITLTLLNFGGIVTGGLSGNGAIVFDIPHAIFSGTDPAIRSQYYYTQALTYTTVVLLDRVLIQYNFTPHPENNSYSIVILPVAPMLTNGNEIAPVDLTVKFRLLY